MWLWHGLHFLHLLEKQQFKRFVLPKMPGILVIRRRFLWLTRPTHVGETGQSLRMVAARSLRFSLVNGRRNWIIGSSRSFGRLTKIESRFALLTNGTMTRGTGFARMAMRI